MRFYFIIIVFLLLLLIFKSETTVNKTYKYSCTKEENNPVYEEYTKKKNTYVDECLGKARQERPQDFVRYFAGVKLDSSYQIYTTRNKCEKEYVKQGNLVPVSTIQKATTCDGLSRVKCITFFGKCIFELGDAQKIQ